MSNASPTDLAREFGLASISDRSLSAWASVYPATTSRGEPVVVKRTAATAERAHAMARWTRALRESGVAVVSPADLDGPNPHQVGDEWWVTYPFVVGNDYDASNDHLEAAGHLLGKLHAAPLSNDDLCGLREYEWPATERKDVDADLDTLTDLATTRLGQAATLAIDALRTLGNRWWETSLPRLKAADADERLPRAGVSSDFKANNLVFGHADAILVDPDNGGIEPRLFDLAMAVVIFHTESDGAPGRLFDEGEWQVFASAYLTHVTLTQRERDLWPEALDHMLWEEGTWILEDSEPAEWNDQRQADYLGDLAVATRDRYPLPDDSPPHTPDAHS